MGLGERGYVFTLVTSMMVIIILSLVMFQTQVFSPSFEDTLTRISLNELHYFVEALKKDAGRACAISGQRSAAYAIDHVIKTNDTFRDYVMKNCTEFNYYTTGIEAALAELMVCGTLENTATPAVGISGYMENNTVLAWVREANANQTSGLPYNVTVRFKNMSMALYDSWHYVILTEFDFVVQDTSDIRNVYSGYNIPVTSVVDVSIMEDPSNYMRSGIPSMIRRFRECNKTLEVNGSVLDMWIDDGCYNSAGGLYNSPSFFDRLEGSIILDDKFVDRAGVILGKLGETPDDIGLESLVNLDLLVEYNFTVDSNLSQVDYQYWNRVPGICTVDEMYGHPSFRLDIDHAIKYDVKGLNCFVGVTQDMGNDKYSPGSLTIPNGTKVTWVEQFGVGHRLVSSPSAWAGTENLPSGGSFQWVFDRPDNYVITCADHGGMFILHVTGE